MFSQSGFLKRSWPVVIQSAEAHRKPRWVPVAKSKIYRIPKRPVIPAEERAELMRVHNNYKTQMRAIRRFYYDEMIREKATTESASSEMSLKLEADEWERCVKLNVEWNAQVAAEREVRRARELATMEEYALARMEALDKENEEKLAKAAKEIQIQKELSSTFITPETIDQAIDHALANPTDYNFAIDLQGNITHGTLTPTQSKNEKTETPTSNA